MGSADGDSLPGGTPGRGVANVPEGARSPWWELGIEPSVELQQLKEQILLKDPSLTLAESIGEMSLNEPMATPRTSRAVRGYEMREEIVAGTFGVVHGAYQASVGREVAAKVIRPWYANNPEFVRRFENEAQLVARLEHPHIVADAPLLSPLKGVYGLGRTLGIGLRAR